MKKLKNEDDSTEHRWATELHEEASYEDITAGLLQ